MSGARALIPLLRVERRDLLRHGRRSLLVVLLVALPVAGLVGGGALIETTRTSDEQARRHAMGAADLLAFAAPRDERETSDARAALDALPRGVRSAPLSVSVARVEARGLVLGARRLDLTPGALEGLARGLLVLRQGRAPATGDEVALSPALLDGLGIDLGDDVTVDGVVQRVVGRVLDAEDTALPLVLGTDTRVVHGWLVAAPHDAAPVIEALRAGGHPLRARVDVTGGDELETVLLFVLGGFACFEAALVIAAAFAVGLNRRRRELALLSAGGAEGRHLVTALLASAGVQAVVGASVGAVAGWCVARLVHPALDGLTGRLNGPLQVSPWVVVGALLMGVATAVGAAWWPARGAVALPVREGLAARRPAARGGEGWLRLGAASVLGGVGLVLGGSTGSGAGAAVAVLAGSVAGLLGFGAMSPWLLGVLARPAAVLPLSWRLAVRDAGRFRGRNGPVVSAVVAGMALSVVVAALLASVDALLSRGAPRWRDDQLVLRGAGAEALARALADELPVVASAPWAAAHRGDEPLLAGFDDGASGRSWVAWGSPELLAALGVDDPRGAGEGLVVLRPEGAPPAVVAWDGTPSASPPTAWLTVDQQVATTPFVLDGAAASRAGLRRGPPPGDALVPWLVRLDRPVTDADEARARALAGARGLAAVETARRPRGGPAGFFRLALLLSLVTGALVIAVAVALGAEESARDEALLHAAGAAPALLARHRAARAAWLALLGCLLAVPAGALPAVGLLHLARDGVELSFVMPWLELLAALVSLPALVYGGTWLWARCRPPTLGALPQRC